MNRKILMLLRNYFPPDLRVYNEARSLTKAGYKVTILCYRNKKQKNIQLIDGINIKRIGNSLFRNIDYLFIHLFHKSLIFMFYLRKELKNDYKLIHVHDLPLLNTALAARYNKKIKVISDLHENYPAALKSWFQENNIIHKILKKILRFFSIQ